MRLYGLDKDSPLRQFEFGRGKAQIEKLTAWLEIGTWVVLQ